jgi:hypothetical protein
VSGYASIHFVAVVHVYNMHLFTICLRCSTLSYSYLFILFVARLTTDIIQTFEKCNSEFKYSDSLNPKRFLTNPAVPVHNDGLDNANSDLILYVNLELINKESDRRLVFFLCCLQCIYLFLMAIYLQESILQCKLI